MIYDCFTFFNELDLLEIRLNELNDVVDFFVIAESTKTHANKPKELYYAKNKERFAEFESKIIHIVVDDMPSNPRDAWVLENYQRNAIEKGLIDCKPDDYVIISDVDEIPRAAAVASFKGEFGILEQELYYYAFNCRNVTYRWRRGAMLRRALMKTPQDVRNITIYLDHVGVVSVIPDAGWHFSYLGNEKDIQKKLQSFSHQEYNNDAYTNTETILKKITEGKDLFGREGTVLRCTEIDETYPAFLVKHKERFSSYIRAVTEEDRLQDNREKEFRAYLRNADRDFFENKLALKRLEEMMEVKKKECLTLKAELKRKRDEITAMKSSLRWRIPDHVYTLLKGSKPRSK